MKKQSNSSSNSASVPKNAQVVNKEHLSNTNKKMAERLSITQKLIEALQKKMAIQSYLLDMSLGRTGA